MQCIAPQEPSSGTVSHGKPQLMVIAMSSQPNIEEILKHSRMEADTIIGHTDSIRREFAEGRPNSSDEASVEGVLKALDLILSNFPGEKATGSVH